LLFPLTAALVAFSRQVVGLNGYGIFIPALVSVAFLSTGVLAGLVIFLAIVIAAVSARFALSKVKLPYLPRMAVLIWVIVMAVLILLLLSPGLSIERLVGLGIYPVLLFIMLAESNIEAQITRTWQTAALMTAETIAIAIVASLVMGTVEVQEWVLLNPEVAVLLILVADWVIGSYKGLRLLEVWRFRKLIKS
ncbi:MAG: 7TM domain-containing protein, partial [Patescibacteria group bacterium]